MNNKTSLRFRKKFSETRINLYNISLLTPEIQTLLLQSSDKLFLQDIEWLMLAFEKIPQLLESLKETNDYESQCFIWFNQAQIVLIHCKSKGILPSTTFIDIVNQMKNMTFNNIKMMSN